MSRVAAERKAGELLANINPNSSAKRESSATQLSDLGISKTQSSRWQQAAKVPEEKFREYVESADVLGKELTSAGLRKLANHAPLHPEVVKWCRQGRLFWLFGKCAHDREACVKNQITITP